ncbi:TolC family protein [Bacteroidetes/Chlorobi group bacterium Naka2016]|jgi:outer membrane protein|nr:MAG: TolC family protein [Bacteroidetes/Chlorobi group bacterium Naka2016]
MKRIFVCLLFFTFFIAYSQEKATKKVYSLDECLAIARESNPQIKIAESQISTAGAEITSAFGNYLPSANFNMGYTRQLNVESGQKINIGGQTIVVGRIEPNSYNMSLTLNYNLFDGFAREAQYSSAKENLNSVYSKYSQALQDVEINVYRTYVNVLRTKKILEARRQDFEVARKELERVEARYKAGAVPYANVLTQEAELANKEILMIQAENDLKNAKANLLIAMGLKPEVDIDVKEEDVKADFSEEEINKFRAEVGDYETLVKKALSNRSDMLAIEQQIASSRANLTIARAGYFPSLSAFGGWSWANNEFRNFSDLGRSFVGLSLRIPIFENFKSNYQIELARAQILQLEMQKLQLEQTVRNQIIQAMNNLESAEKQLVAAKKSLESAQKNFESAQERYRLGSIGIVDYVYANNLLISSKINHINSIYNYYQAQKELLYSIGSLNSK